MKQNLAKKLFTGLLVGLIMGLVAWLITQVLFKPFFFRMEAQSYDWRLRRVVEQPKTPIDDIVIIDVDERSVAKLGSYHQWPRKYWAKMIRFLNENEVKLIGLDFIFDPDRRHPEEDQEFRQAIQECGKVVNALYFSRADSEHFRYAMSQEPKGLNYQPLLQEVPETLFHNLISEERLEPENPLFLNAGLSAGFVNLYPDPDGVLRRIPLFIRFNQHVYAAFSMQMAMQALQVEKVDYEPPYLILTTKAGQVINVPIDKYGQMLIRYMGGFKSFRYISFYDVLMGFVPKEFFRGKIVIFGSSLPGLYDLRTTPLQPAYPGVEVNANVVYDILNQQFIYRLSGTTVLLIILLTGLITGLLLIFLRPVGSILVSALFIFLILIGGLWFLSQFSLWVPIIAPIFTVILVFATVYVYRYLFEEKDKRRIRKIFSHYVSPNVVNEILEHPEKVKLGGERKVCTALFSDVAGFTTISEQMEPEELVALLNEYLTEMTNIVFEYHGMLDKYEGDAIMAVFGAPVEFPEHAEYACHAAIKMQKRLAQLREKWKDQGKPQLHARIGINSGDMVVGNMGSNTRFDYTVMGDTVNLASRLEGANKVYGTEIMIGENTFKLVNEKFVTRPLDLLRVKGKKKPVKVYELIASRDEKLPPEFEEMLAQYQKGFDYYLMRNWEWAMNHFRQALQIKADDGPSRIYLLRCQEFMENPPGEDWDGVFVMKTK